MLCDDGDAKALGLQGTADHRHAEAGVIHLGIPRHQDDIAGIPAESIRLLPGHG